MAQEVQISPGSSERIAKIRDPVAVAALTFITLGIYGLYWWYQINREMADLGAARGVDGLGEKPIYSLLAFFPGALIVVPPFVSLYRGSERIRRAQEAAPGEVSYNGWIVLALVVGSFLIGFVGLVVPGYIQSELNKVWKSVAAGETPPAVAPPETPPTAVTPAEGQPPGEPPTQV
jgi:hypothetical protein